VHSSSLGRTYAGARSLERLRGAMLLALLLHAAAAAAVDEVKFRVQITAPSDLTSLLEANLDIVRWSIRPDVSEDQLRQLLKTAPQQVRDLLATEGYFSPAVESALDRDQQRWIRSARTWSPACTCRAMRGATCTA